MSIIKFLIITFLGVIGVERFGKEIFEDIFENPIQYSTSLFTGIFSYVQISQPTSELLIPEIIKFIFFILGAFFSCIIVFITKKLLEPLYEQRLKKIIYKWLNLKE